jgi:phage portal protein BeeE
LLGETLWAIERDKKGRPLELVPIVPTWVRSVPAPGRPYFEILPPSGKAFALPVIDAVWIRQLDPFDPFMGRGVGTAGALADELETDEYMAMTAKSRFANRAMPEVILGLLGQAPHIPPPNAAEIDLVAKSLEEKHRGSERAGQMHIVSGDFKAIPLGQTMVENQHVQGREFLRNTFMQVFGTPPEVLGVLDNANRSTIEAAAFHFACYSTVPVVELHRSALQEQLLPEYGADLIADYVSPIPTDREFEKGVMVALPAAFKINEVRAMANRAPVEGGDEFYKAASGNVPTPGEKADVPEGDAADDADDDDEEEVPDDDDDA